MLIPTGSQLADCSVRSHLLHFLCNSWFAYDVISSHWTSSWLILKSTLAVYNEIVVSIYSFIVSLSLLWMLILRYVTYVAQ